MDSSELEESNRELNMDLIKGINWAQDMWQKLQLDLKKTFLSWIEIALTMSQNEEDISEWKTIFIEQFGERCDELVTDIKDLHAQVVVNIEENLNKIEVLCKMLQVQLPRIEKQECGLYQVQFQLKKQHTKLEKMVEIRQAELSELRKKELIVSQSLGRPPKPLDDQPLPSANKILDFQKHIEDLEQEKFDRLEKFTAIKEELVQIIQDLEYTPCTKFEEDILNADEKDFMVTDDNMQALDTFHLYMKKKVKEVKDEISQLRNKIEQLWTLLDVDFVDRENFRKKHIGHSINVLESLRLEFKRCECAKRANIKRFVENLRQELLQLWHHCHCSENIRNEFTFFYSDTYTEDLLELHEIQLQRWKMYAEENKEMISLLNKHRSLWEKLIELEQNAVGPDRFNNRGGKLLKEEKERNLLSKKIPKIEVQLMELANRFQARQGTPFLTFEQTVEEYINSVHDQRENTKKLKLSARKLQKESTMQTPNLPCTSVMTSKRPLAEIPVTDNKKLKATPRKVVTEPRKKRNALQIPKILVSSANRSKRLSQERQKRIEKIRRLSRQKLQRESGSYAEFQNNLTQRVDLRSTINLAASTSRDDTSELANPLTKTPDANKFKTPTRTPFRTPNNGTSSVSKLSTVKSQMKLIF